MQDARLDQDISLDESRIPRLSIRRAPSDRRSMDTQTCVRACSFHVDLGSVEGGITTGSRTEGDRVEVDDFVDRVVLDETLEFFSSDGEEEVRHRQAEGGEGCVGGDEVGDSWCSEEELVERGGVDGGDKSGETKVGDGGGDDGCGGFEYGGDDVDD